MSSARTKKPSPRLSPASWIEAAMDVLVERGVAAIAVEPLAARLGATKGSFYHHFDSREALVRATLEDWERAQTDVVLERLEAISDPAERIRAVMAAAYADFHGGIRDAALLASADDPLVRPVVERVTRRRIEYLTARYAETGMAKKQARRRAGLIYSAYLGFFGCVRAFDGPVFGLSDLNGFTAEMLQVLVSGG